MGGGGEGGDNRNNRNGESAKNAHLEPCQHNSRNLQIPNFFLVIFLGGKPSFFCCLLY